MVIVPPRYTASLPLRVTVLKLPSVSPEAAAIFPAIFIVPPVLDPVWTSISNDSTEVPPPATSTPAISD